MLKDLIYRDRTYRGFDRSYRFTREEMEEFADVMRMSPSSMNGQALKFYLAWEEESVARVQKATGWAKRMPEITLPHPGKEPTAFIVICLDTEISKNLALYTRDAAIAAHSALLLATEKGLGGCMIGSIHAGQLKEIVGGGDRFMPLLVVALGKPDETIRIIPVPEDGNTDYFRDENDVHYLPKRTLKDVLLN